MDKKVEGVDILEDEHNELSAIYRGTDDLVNVRVKMGQRIVAKFKDRMGIDPGEDETKIAKLIKKIEEEYKVLTHGIVKLTKAKASKIVRKSTLFDKWTEVMLLDDYEKMVEQETVNVYRMKLMLTEFPIWNEYLDYVKGCGPKTATAIISEMDITAALYPSSFVRYCGLDVVPRTEKTKAKAMKDMPKFKAESEETEADDMLAYLAMYYRKVQSDEGRRNFNHHLVPKEATDSEGNVTKFNGLSYNPRLKSKLVFIMAGSIIKAGGYYKTEVYDPYKARLPHKQVESINPLTGEVSMIKPYAGDGQKAHRHAMAMRYMTKQFLIDLFLYWKKMDGGEIIEPYGVAKLGMKAHSRWTFNECLAMCKERGGRPEDYIGNAKRT